MLLEDRTLARNVLIALSATIDINSILGGLIFNVVILKNSTLISTFLIGMTVRIITLYLLILPYPVSKIWFHTGYFTFCPFDPTCDYFYSGHMMLMGLIFTMAYNRGGSNRNLLCSV